MFFSICSPQILSLRAATTLLHYHYEMYVECIEEKREKNSWRNLEIKMQFMKATKEGVEVGWHRPR